MKMSSSTNPIVKPKFSSLNGHYPNKDRERDSNTREKKLSGNSPVTNILYFNYNTKENEMSDGAKLKAIKNSTDTKNSPQFNSNQRNHSVKKQYSGFNSTDSKFFPVSQMKSVRFNNEKLSNTVEIEALRDEIFKLKVENNKMKQDQIELRAENKRFEEDYKKSIKVLEEILKEGGSAAHDVLNSIMRRNTHSEEKLEIDDYQQTFEDNLNIERAKFSLSTNTFFRLKEMFVINSLKNQINQSKQVIKKQEDEIENFKNNARVTRLVKLEHNFNNSSNELAILKGEYENLKNQYEETIEKFRENLEEKNYCKMMMQKYKAQLQEAKGNLKTVKEDNSKLKEARRIQDEKIVYLSKITKPMSGILKLKDLEKELAKEDQIIIEKADFDNLESKAKNLENLEKRMEEILKENRVLIEQNEIKNKKISEFGNSLDSLHNLNNENEKEIKELNRILKSHEKEIDNLLKENIKVKNEFEDFKNELHTKQENTNEEKKRIENELESLRKESIVEKENLNAKLNKLEKELEKLRNESNKEKDSFIEEKKVCENQIESLKIKIETAIKENHNLRETLSNENNEIQRQFDNYRIEAFKQKESIDSKIDVIIYILDELQEYKKLTQEQSQQIKLLENKYPQSDNEVINLGEKNQDIGIKSQETKEKTDCKKLEIIKEEKPQELEENKQHNKEVNELQEEKVELQKLKAGIVLHDVMEEREDKEISQSVDHDENQEENNQELSPNQNQIVLENQENNKSINSSLDEKRGNSQDNNQPKNKSKNISQNQITSSSRHHSAIIKPVEPLTETAEVPTKRLSLKAKLKDIIFDSGKIFTLKKQDTVPVYTPQQSETIQTANNFIINVDASERQDIDPTQTFYIQDPEAEEKKKKAKEVVKKPPTMKKMKTIERVMIEKFSKFNSIDDMIDDPEINLYLK